MSSNQMVVPTPQAAYIGPPELGPFLENLHPEWSFYPHLEHLTQFRSNVEQGVYVNGIHAVIVFDGLFDPSSAGGQFEKFIGDFSPYCLFAIASYNPESRDVIRERVEAWRYTNSSPDGKIYFIDKDKPVKDFRDAINSFIADPPFDAQEAAWVISGGTYTPAENHEPVHIEPVSIGDGDFFMAPKDFGNECLGQVVAVTSSKGGSGKSTMALSLATYLAHSSIQSVREGLEQKPLKIVILDLDIRDSQVGFFAGLYRPTVLNLRRKGISPETIAETAIYHPGLKLDVILGPRKPRSAEDVPPDFYTELIQTLRGLYDYVFLDTSVQYTDPLLEKVAYPIADQIILVTEVAIPSVHSMFRWIQEVTGPVEKRGMNIPKTKIAIIVNKAINQVALAGSEIVENAQGIPILTAVPSNQKLIVLATNLSSLEVVLKNESIKNAIGRAVEAIVGDRYRLSKNLGIAGGDEEPEG